MKQRFFVIFLAMISGLAVCHAQKKEAILDYINAFKDIAVSEMLRTGVPASITLAQGIHESGAGLSELVIASNNHFGIKCKTNWTGETVRHDDDARAECFRKYPSPADSYKDHSDFLKSGTRYASLFSLDPVDYKSWAKGLKQAGYATNPKYPEVLIKLIEDYNLQDFTLLALGKKSGNLSADSDVANHTGNIQLIQENEKPGTPDPIPVMQVTDTPAFPDYPFKINETKVIFVKKGISYFSLAQQYNVDLKNLYKFNDMQPAEQTGYDQLVYLQPKRKTGNNDFHTVMPGETLHDIAQAEAIRLESLQELNWLKDGQVPANGEKLSLKKKSETIPKLALKDNFSLIPDRNPQSSH